MADRDDALAVWEQMRAHAHRRGSLLGFLGTNLWSGASLLWRGDLPEAETRLVAALENARAWGLLESGAAYGPAFAFTAAVRILRGDLEGARQLVDHLAADGRSNKEIAQTLYVTLKTVEVHLSNAYRKLDIRSRRDLGRALAA